METTLHGCDTSGVKHPEAVQESRVLSGHTERGEAAEENHHDHLHTEDGFVLICHNPDTF